MTSPEIPPDEGHRLTALQDLQILDTPPEHRFDRITRLAARILDVPVAVISLVDHDRQWFKSCVGLPFHETPREHSFCAHTILSSGTLIVPDLSQDVRFARNPYVTGNPDLRFYAGHPLSAADGSKLGTLAIMDHRARELNAENLQTLEDLSGWAESELRVGRLNRARQELISELDSFRRQSILDPLTLLWNRPGILDIVERELARARRDKTSVGLVMADLDHFKRINDTYGHQAGDSVLREVAHRMRSSVRFYDAIGRYGGEEFLILLPGCDSPGAMIMAERVRSMVAATPVEAGVVKIPITVSLGVTASGYAEETDGEKLIAMADQALYRAKEQGRNRSVLAERKQAGP